MGWSDTWVALDTETTGFGPEARIIEIGLVRFSYGVPVASWSQLLYPPQVDWESTRVQEALKVNGLSRDDLVGKPIFGQVYAELLDRMDCPVWVAHNVEFDLRMLMQECNHFGRLALMQLPALAFCTMSLAYQLEPELPNHKLGTVADRWRVAQDQSHRALSDATTSGKVLSEMYGDGLLPDDDQRMVTLYQASQRSWKRRRKVAV